MKGWKRILLLVAIAALVAPSAHALSAKFACNAGGRVFQVSAVGQVDITLTWPKGAPDNDLFVFDSAGDLAAIGFSSATRYEGVAYAFPATMDVVAIKFNGPNGPCILNASARSFSATNGRTGLRHVGSLEELAFEDERYQRIQEKIQELRASKRPSRSR